MNAYKLGRVFFVVFLESSPLSHDDDDEKLEEWTWTLKLAQHFKFCHYTGYCYIER